jgi:hypothetical protein
MVTKDGSSMKDVRNKISKANGAFNNYRKFGNQMIFH